MRKRDSKAQDKKDTKTAPTEENKVEEDPEETPVIRDEQGRI